MLFVNLFPELLLRLLSLGESCPLFSYLEPIRPNSLVLGFVLIYASPLILSLKFNCWTCWVSIVQDFGSAKGR